MVFLTFVTSPYRSLLISHENIVFISIIEICDAALKALIAVSLLHISYDRLFAYGLLLVAINLFNFILFAGYCYMKYEECVAKPWQYYQKSYIGELVSFAGWNLYGTGCTIGRTQGLSIVFNKFIGPTINAAYGISLQASSCSNFLSAALTNATRPQITKAEGSGDREKALWLTVITTKFSFFLTSMVAVPLLFEIRPILAAWLGQVPEYSVLLCYMVLLGTLVDSTTLGLEYIIQAIGDIKTYVIVKNTPKLLTVPLAIVLLLMGFPIMSVAVSYVTIEALCAFVRIYLLHKKTGFAFRDYIDGVLKRAAIPTLVCVVCCLACTNMLNFDYRFVLTFCMAFSLHAISIYLFGIGTSEKAVISNMANAAKLYFRRF